MGYYTHYNGDVTFDLEEKEYVFLKWVIEHRFGTAMTMERNKIIIQGEWKNRMVYLEDVLLYIVKNGELLDVDIIGYGEEPEDVSQFSVLEGVPVYYRFDYNEEKKEKKTFAEWASYIGEEPLDNYTVQTDDEDLEDECTEQFDSLLDGVVEDRSAWIQKIEKEINEGNLSLLTTFNNTKFELSKEGCFQIAFEQQSEPEDVQILSMFADNVLLLSNYDPHKQSIGHALIDHHEYPLDHQLMQYIMLSGLEEDVMIKANDGKVSRICSLCTNRLKAVTNSCRSCQPELINQQ